MSGHFHLLSVVIAVSQALFFFGFNGDSGVALQNTASIKKDVAPVLHDLARPHILHFDLPYFQSFVPYSTYHLVVQADRVIQAVFRRNPLEVAENLAMGGVTAWYTTGQDAK